MKRSWASRSAGCMTDAATFGAASTSTMPTKTAKTRYAMSSDGSSAASALPMRNSSPRTGVVSAGSRVPC